VKEPQTALEASTQAPKTPLSSGHGVATLGKDKRYVPSWGQRKALSRGVGLIGHLLGSEHEVPTHDRVPKEPAKVALGNDPGNVFGSAEATKGEQPRLPSQLLESAGLKEFPVKVAKESSLEFPVEAPPKDSP